MEQVLRICPCVLLSKLNGWGIDSSCEIDMCSAKGLILCKAVAPPRHCCLGKICGLFPELLPEQEILQHSGHCRDGAILETLLIACNAGLSQDADHAGRTFES